MFSGMGKRRKSGFASLLMAMVLMLVAAGCGSEGNGADNTASPSGAPAESAAAPAQSVAAETEAPASETPAAETFAAVTIRHAMGEATISQQPLRVVYLYQSMLDIGAALGVKPVGAIESTDQKPWFAYLGDMSGVENLGDEGQPNVEAILALKPDVIFATKVRHEKIYPQLEAIAPTIVSDDLADWKGNLTLAGEALGLKAEADAILSDWNAKVAEFKTKMGDRLQSTTVSVIRVQRDDSMKVYLKGFPGLIMRELGLNPPEAQRVEFEGSGLDLMSKEHIPQLDADYIFDITTPLPGQENIPELYEGWTSHPLWAGLEAVKNGKYYRVDPITWNFGAGPFAAGKMLEDVFDLFEID